MDIKECGGRLSPDMAQQSGSRTRGRISKAVLFMLRIVILKVHIQEERGGEITQHQEGERLHGIQGGVYPG